MDVKAESSRHIVPNGDCDMSNLLVSTYLTSSFRIYDCLNATARVLAGSAGEINATAQMPLLSRSFTL